MLGFCCIRYGKAQDNVNRQRKGRLNPHHPAPLLEIRPGQAQLPAACRRRAGGQTLDRRAHQLGLRRVSTIERLRRRFVEQGFDTALHGKQREPLREKLLDGRAEAALIALRCSDPPQGHRQWSLRLLADRMVALKHVEHMSHESVRQLLKKTSSSPGR